MNNAVKEFEHLHGESIMTSLLDSNPEPFPTGVHMSGESVSKHVRLGRRFEMSMMMFAVDKCDCCGVVKPRHSDPAFPSEVIFSRKVFMNKIHKAYHCICDGICRGSQFYSANRPTHIEWYRGKHNGMNPMECIGIDQPNALLCNNCHTEISSDNVHGKYPPH
jgi:hypothetical protein